MVLSGNDVATPVAAHLAQSRMDFSHKQIALHIALCNLGGTYCMCCQLLLKVKQGNIPDREYSLSTFNYLETLRPPF